MDRFAALALESSLRAAMIIACAGIAAWLLRSRAAELRHLVWLAALLATLVMPALLVLAPRWSVPVLPARTGGPSASLALVAVPAQAGSAAARPAAPPRRSPLRALPLVWLAGCVALLGREIGARHRLRRLRAGSRFSLALHASLRSVTNALGSHARVRCRVSPAVAVPLVFGTTRSTLLLPEAAESWDRACLRRVLLHELAHVRRRDPLWITFAHTVRALYWFHPLVWLAAARMREESEQACDDAVVRRGERPSDYAETLLYVAERAAPFRISVASPFVVRRGLESRISGILSARRDVRAPGAARRTLIAGAAALVATALVVTQPVAATASAGRSAPEAATPAPYGGGSHAWLARAGTSPRVKASFWNDAGAPVRILEASARVVPGVEGGESGITGVELALQNDDRSRRVTGLRIAIDLPRTKDRTECAVEIAANDRGRLVLGTNQWSAVVPEGDVTQLLVHVAAVRFDRGDAWELREQALAAPEARSEPAMPAPAAPLAGTRPRGEAATPAPAPPATAAEPQGARPAQPAPTPRPLREGAPRAFPSGPTVPARFRNPADAPVVITSARTPEHDPSAGPGETLLPEVRVENRSGHRVLAVKVRYKASPESHAVTFFSTPIAPGGVALLWRDFTVEGRAADMTVQVVGVRFDNGDVWGFLDSLIDARDAWVPPLTNDAR